MFKQSEFEIPLVYTHQVHVHAIFHHENFLPTYSEIIETILIFHDSIIL